MERITSRKNPLLEHIRRLDRAARTAANAALFCATVPSWWTRRCATA